MKFKLYFVCILSCFALLFTSCNEATPEQIQETEMAEKKEALLENKHEKDVKRCLNVLSEESKKIDYYYFEKNKQNEAINLLVNIEKVSKIPEYSELVKIHNEYHKYSTWDEVDLMKENFRKWNIVDGKIQNQKDTGKYVTIEPTLCPFCRYLFDDHTDEEDNPYGYLFYSDIEKFSSYFSKIKLFGYYLNNPSNISGYVEARNKFELSNMPTYTIKKLIDTYDNKIKALEKDDEFGLNKSVDTFKKSLKGKWIRVKANIQNIEQTHSTNKTTGKEQYFWKITLYDASSGYHMKVYILKETSASEKPIYGWFPKDEDMKKVKKDNQITLATQLYTGEPKEVYYQFLLPFETDLHFGYSEILEIK